MSTTQQFTLPPMELASQIARSHLAEVLPGTGLDRLAADAAIVVTELVENAVQHTTGGCTLLVHCDAPVLAVTVTDTSTLPPELLPLSETRAYGRGLHLVDKLTQRWGYRPTSGGKVVWAQLVAS